MPLYNPNQGGVSNVTTSPPLVSSGGSNPEISFDSSTPNGVYSLNVNSGTFTLVETIGETVGSIKAFATTVIPSNYLWCNGSTVLIATYPDLFDVIGITYGGDGITNFNLPNLTNRFIKGDNGSNIGTQTGTNNLTENQLPIVTLTGTIEVSSNQGDIFGQTNAWISGGGSTDGGEIVLLFVEDGLQGSTISISGFNANSFGNNEEHEHPNLTLRYAICFESVGVSTASPTPSFSQTLAVSNDSNIRAQFNGVNYLTENDVIDYVFENGLTLTGPNVKLGGTLAENTNIIGTTQTFSISSELNGTSPDYFKFLIGDVGKGQDGVQLFYDGTILNDAVAEITINDEADIYLSTSNSSDFAEIYATPNGRVKIRATNGTVEVTEDGVGLLGIKVLVDTDETNEGLTGFYDYSSNYTSLSYVQKGYVDDSISTAIVSGLIVEQTHTSGPSVIIDDTTTILYVDPASTIASLTIILPENPINGQEVKVSFGGTIPLGVVCTVLAVTGNTGHTVLGGVGITDANAGDGYIFKFQSSTNLWRIF